MALGLVMHTVAARRLGVDEYGVFTYALNGATLGSLLLTLGWPTSAMRFVAQYREAEQWGLLRGLMTRSHQVVLSVSVASALVIALVGRYALTSPSARLSAALISLMLPVISLGLLRIRLLRGLLRVSDSIIAERLAIPLLVVVGLVVLPAVGGVHVVLLWVGAALVVRAVETGRLRSARPDGVASSAREYRTGEWGRVAIAIALGEVARATLARGDTMMLGAMSGMHDVAVYGASRRVGMLITFTLNAVNAIAGPLLASAYHGGRPSEFRRVLRKAALWSMLGALPVFTWVVVAPESVLWLFGPEFRGHGSVVRIVALGQFANAATGPVVMALLMTGRQRRYSLAVGVVAAVSLAANAFVIPVWGLHGAAWIATGCTACLNAWLFVQARRAVPLDESDAA
jgi:O-antigen/teichoic acid export membrane protein